MDHTTGLKSETVISVPAEKVNVEIVCDKCGGPRDAYVGRLQPSDKVRYDEPQEHNDNEVDSEMLTNGFHWVLRFSTCRDCWEP